MATICLITAPVSTDYETIEDALSPSVRAAARAPKLGILALASALEQAGHTPLIIDLDDAYAEYLSEGKLGLAGFPAWVAPRIQATGVSLFGFGSICSSYPITIRVAKCLKDLDRSLAILLGGPQASAADTSTLSAFPFIDFILRGEADTTLPVFVQQFSGARAFETVAGLSWRSPFGIQRNAAASVIIDLDDLPLPAYHLSSHLEEADYAFLELGRGCPFACTFCSTNDFFRRKFRVRSPHRVLEDMRWMAANYGFRGFNLVHDMFTVDRRKVVSFCEVMIEAGKGFNWSCSARTDCVDEELLKLMARAGCDGIFFGVETGSRRMQRIIDKDLDPIQARHAVEIAERLGMSATVSTIVGFPEEIETDLRETVDVFMHAMRHPHAVPQINILAPLSGTPIYEQYKGAMILEEVGSQLSYPGQSLSDPDFAMVREHPAIFPNFYILPTPSLDRSELLELAEFLPMGRRAVRWLMVALHQLSSDILITFRAWRGHRLVLHPALRGSNLRRYYGSEQSRDDFTSFLRQKWSEVSCTAVNLLVSYEERLAAAKAEEPIRPKNVSMNKRIPLNGIPLRVPGLHVFELDANIQDVIDSLKGGGAMSAVRKNPTHYRTTCDSPDDICLVEISQIIAEALSLCNGTNRVVDFEVKAARLFDYTPDLCRYAARTLLKGLRDHALINVYNAD